VRWSGAIGSESHHACIRDVDIADQDSRAHRTGRDSLVLNGTGRLPAGVETEFGRDTLAPRMKCVGAACASIASHLMSSGLLTTSPPLTDAVRRERLGAEQSRTAQAPSVSDCDGHRSSRVVPDDGVLVFHDDDRAPGMS